MLPVFSLGNGFLLRNAAGISKLKVMRSKLLTAACAWPAAKVNARCVASEVPACVSPYVCGGWRSPPRAIRAVTSLFSFSRIISLIGTKTALCSTS